MSMETRRQEQDVRVYRCDLVRPEGQCVRETASFHSEGDVTVLVDPAWLVLRVGLGEEKHFCGWDHVHEWTTNEHVVALAREEGAIISGSLGEFAVRMRSMLRDREIRESQTAARMSAQRMEQTQANEILETP